MPNSKARIFFMINANAYKSIHILFSVSNTKEESITLKSSDEQDFAILRIILIQRIECVTMRSTFLLFDIPFN